MKKTILTGIALMSLILNLNAQLYAPDDKIRFSEDRGFDYDPNTDSVYFNDFNTGRVITFGHGGNLSTTGFVAANGNIWALGNKIRFSEDRGFDYDPNTDSVYFNDFNTGRVIMFGAGGKVAIGTLTPTADSRLTVNGKIHAEEVKIDLTIAPDYVFQKYYLGASTLKADYVMPTLEEVEAYTKANHHLPEMPSAKQLQEDGLQVGEMVNKLLQKIEELTLYTIEQEKRLNAQQKEIENLKIKN